MSILKRSHIESSVIRADRTERLVESSYSFITHDGTRMAMLSIVRNITDKGARFLCTEIGRGPNLAKKWTMPIRDWKPALNRLAIEFEGRFPR